MFEPHPIAADIPEHLQQWVADTMYLLEQIEPKPSDPRLLWARTLLTQELARKLDLATKCSGPHDRGATHQRASSGH